MPETNYIERVLGERIEEKDMRKEKTKVWKIKLKKQNYQNKKL